MFNDERINSRIAKLYFNLVLIIFIPTSIFTLVKGLYWSRLATFGLSFFFFEISIVLSGIIILLIDLIFFRLKGNKDEYYLYKRYKYYQRASLVFLACIIVGFVLAVINNSMRFYFFDLYQLSIPLLTICVIYSNLYLKNNKIFFNYKFIENKTGYYKQVLINILKLLLGMIGLFVFVSACIFIIFNQSFDGSLYLVKINLYVSICIFLLVVSMYLFASVVERLNYLDTSNKKLFLRSQILIGIAFIAVSIPVYFPSIITTLWSSFPNQSIFALLILRDMLNILEHASIILFSYLISNLVVSLNKRVKLVNGFIALTVAKLTLTLLSYSALLFISALTTTEQYLFYGNIVQWTIIIITLLSQALLIVIAIYLAVINNFNKKLNIVLAVGVLLIILARVYFSIFPSSVTASGLITTRLLELVYYVIFILIISLNKNKFDLISNSNLT